MSSQPTISVVLSVYNGEDSIRQSIESILNQTFTDYELIIIDDGSTDDTKKIIKSITDDRITFISRRNKGLVASLNEGIKKARGTYIARQDADDTSKPQRFANQVAYMDSHPEVGVLGTFAELINGQDKKQGSYQTPYLAPDLRRRLYLGNTLVHGSVMARRKLMVAHPYVSLYGPTEDYILWGELSLETDLATLPLELYSYQLNEGGNSVFNSREDTTQTQAAQDLLWSKNVFPTDSIGGLVSRGRVYKKVSSKIIYSQYLSDQVQLIRELHVHRLVKPLIITFCGLLLLSPRSAIRSIVLVIRKKP